MLRTWLTWGLTSTLLYTACGGGSENELFGNVKPGSGGSSTSIEPSLGEDGGSSEGPPSTAAGKAATGGRVAQNDLPAGGGHDAGSGGAANVGGGPAEPSAGSSEPGAAGESAGGATSGTGGTDSGGGHETGGQQTGGNASGGTTGGSETGGTGTGGSTGGTTGGTGTGGSTGGTTGGTTGGSATGGQAQGGAGACAVARAQLQKLLIEAQECDPDSRSACKSLVPDECECNNIPVGDPVSDATSLYLDQLERVKKACGEIRCVALVCTEVVGHCSPRTEGPGHCVALINTPEPTPDR